MRSVFGALGAACVATVVRHRSRTPATLNPRDLRPLASFSGIGDQAERSRALFNEIAKVVTHPRCMNCHPAGNHPLQGNDQHEHMPPVPRGEAGLGVAGRRVLGLSHRAEFHAGRRRLDLQEHSGPCALGPRAARNGVGGKSVGAICQQLKDPARNGGRTLALLHEHFAKDDLVAWGWEPGEGREPAPGNQKAARASWCRRGSTPAR
jgi:hypothetical protein